MLTIPFYYLPGLLFLSALQIGLYFVPQRVGNPGAVQHGVRQRCTPEVHCTPGNRTAFDTSFLCCEDATWWPASHTASPIGAPVITGSPALSAFCVFKWEALEADALTYIGAFVIYPTNGEQLESTTGSLIGDAQISGLLGVLLGSLILSYSGFPGFLPVMLEEGAVAQFTLRRIKSYWVIVRYVAVLVLYEACFLVGGRATNGTPSFVFGPYITVGVLGLFLFGLFPYMIRSDDVVGVDTNKHFRRAAPLLFLCTVIIGCGALGLKWLANDWFQVWMLYYVATLFVMGWSVIFPHRGSLPLLASLERQLRVIDLQRK